MAHVYLKFLQNIASLEPIQLKHKDLSPTAILLLNEIAVKDFEEQPLTVTQARSVGKNRRTKYLYITKVAFDYFQTKSKAMVKAVES